VPIGLCQHRAAVPVRLTNDAGNASRGQNRKGSNYNFWCSSHETWTFTALRRHIRIIRARWSLSSLAEAREKSFASGAFERCRDRDGLK
jgi:hypothetical protein